MQEQRQLRLERLEEVEQALERLEEAERALTTAQKLVRVQELERALERLQKLKRAKAPVLHPDLDLEWEQTLERVRAWKGEINLAVERERHYSRSLLEGLAKVVSISHRQRRYFLQTVEDRLANEEEAPTAEDVHRVTLSLMIDLADVVWRSHWDRPPSFRPWVSLATAGVGALAGGLAGLAVVSNVVTVLGAHLTAEQLIAGAGCAVAGAGIGVWTRFRGRPRREQ